VNLKTIFMRLIIILIGISHVYCQHFQDEIGRAKVLSDGGQALKPIPPKLSAQQLVWEVPSEGPILRDKIRESYLTILSSVSGSHADSSTLTGSDFRAVLLKFFNPHSKFLSEAELHEFDAQVNIFLSRQGFGGELGMAAPLPLHFLQQQRSTMFLKDLSEKLVHVRGVEKGKSTLKHLEDLRETEDRLMKESQ